MIGPPIFQAAGVTALAVLTAWCLGLLPWGRR